jgi:type VI secretion system VasD/TssJ family lipoprotein
MALVLEGSADSNGGNAVSVGVYQLSSDSRFRRAPVEVFWRDARSALEEDLVGRPLTVVLYPDERRVLEVDLAEGARFVGVAANLRDPDSGGWRRVYPVGEARGGVHLRVEARLLAAAPPGP